METSEVEQQEDLPSRSEWNGLESTEHMDFNNTTSPPYTTDITTASTIMTTTTSNSNRITLNPTTADSDSDCDSATIRAGATTADSDCDSATIRAGATTADSDCDSATTRAGATAAIITNTSSTPITTFTASTTDATTTDFTTNSTAATTISTSDFTSTDPTTTSTTGDLTTDTTTSDLTTSTSTTTNYSSDLTAATTTTTTTTTTSTSTTTTTTRPTTTLTADDDQTDEERSDELYIENATSAAADRTAGSEDHVVTSTPTHLRPAPPITLALSGSRPRKKKMLLAPALSLTLERSDSALSEDFPSTFLSPSADQEDDTTLDMILDAMETPSDSESLHFPTYDLDLEDEFRRLGVSCVRSGSSPRPGRRSRGFGSESASGLGCLDREDSVDSEGTRWRTFSTGQPEAAGPPQEEGRVNMSVVEPYLRVLSHGGYHGDGMNDIIVFSSCYLPENSLNNYHYVMDNLFRYAVGTLDLMVAENYVIVYLCAGAQKERLPGISWLRECYTTIHRRLRKNLKGLYVVHPTWFIKAMITIIKPFISSKFSRKLQFVDSLQELSQLIPTEHVQIPDSVRQFDENLNR